MQLGEGAGGANNLAIGGENLHEAAWLVFTLHWICQECTGEAVSASLRMPVLWARIQLSLLPRSRHSGHTCVHTLSRFPCFDFSVYDVGMVVDHGCRPGMLKDANDRLALMQKLQRNDIPGRH